MSACPCGSGESYADCCERYHRGAEPASPELLMRSRYAAFVKQDAAYLFRTLHADHDDKAAGEAALKRSLRAQKGRVVYQGLTILETVEPDAEGAAQVRFHARVKARGADQSFEERSVFLHDGVGWRYLAGSLKRSPKA